MVISDEIISRYQAFFENLIDESVEDYRNLAAPEVRYRDPLEDAKGIDAVTAYLHNWFVTFIEVQIENNNSTADGLVVYQEWDAKFIPLKDPKNPLEIEGITKVTFNEDGLVVDHIDYWDASLFFERVPILGRVVTLMKKLAA